MWTKPTFFEGEKEDELRSRFVQLCALYPKDNYNSIAVFVLTEKNKAAIEPEWRAEQLAKYWIADLSVREEIRIASQTGGKPSDVAGITSREQRLAQLSAMSVDISISADVRLKAFELIAKMEGEITKQVDVQSKGKAVESPAYRYVVVRDPAVIAQEG